MNTNINTKIKILAIASVANFNLYSANVNFAMANTIMGEVNASRFLSKATFGPNETAINAAKTLSYEQWLNTQFSLPATNLLPGYDAHAIAVPTSVGVNGYSSNFLDEFYKASLKANDQLRQRVAFALSEIFVISYAEDRIARAPRSSVGYYDTLINGAFGNYRDLLKKISLHPAMAMYLTSINNMKANGKGRMPDENYARELLQLFSIGLYQLNINGTLKLDATGKPIETYTNKDISGLAKVFTGWSFNKAVVPYFGYDLSGGNLAVSTDRFILPMSQYAAYHSPEPKSFLGISIPAGTSGEASLEIAIDTIFNHSNMPPFIAKQLIQKLVTSNPSSAYVARVANVFKNNGAGIRGDLKAVIKAILLDTEATNVDVFATKNQGKVREPVLRLTHTLRAFNATSTSGYWPIKNTSNTTTQLGQTPLYAPSVFNFFRPNYMPPNTISSKNGLLVPEMQLINAASVVGYYNFMTNIINAGVGPGNPRDIQLNYAGFSAKAGNANNLMQSLDLVFTGNSMTTATKGKIINAINSINIPIAIKNAAGTVTNQAAIDSALVKRVKMGALLTVSSPEYIIQK
jgi:uncharacterized protein (DUF1800 family)